MYKINSIPFLPAAIVVATSAVAAGLAPPHSIDGDEVAAGTSSAGTLSLPLLSASFDVRFSDGEIVVRSEDGFITGTFHIDATSTKGDDDVFLLPAGEQLMLGWSHERSDGIHSTLMDLRTGVIVAEMHTSEWRNKAVPQLLMTTIFSQGCDPDFSTCVTAATSACDPLLAAVSYSCEPQTGKVSCSWECVTGPGGGGD